MFSRSKTGQDNHGKWLNFAGITSKAWLKARPRDNRPRLRRPLDGNGTLAAEALAYPHGWPKRPRILRFTRDPSPCMSVADRAVESRSRDQYHRKTAQPLGLGTRRQTRRTWPLRQSPDQGPLWLSRRSQRWLWVRFRETVSFKNEDPRIHHYYRGWLISALLLDEMQTNRSSKSDRNPTSMPKVNSHPASEKQSQSASDFTT